MALLRNSVARWVLTCLCNVIDRNKRRCLGFQRRSTSLTSHTFPTPWQRRYVRSLSTIGCLTRRRKRYTLFDCICPGSYDVIALRIGWLTPSPATNRRAVRRYYRDTVVPFLTLPVPYNLWYFLAAQYVASSAVLYRVVTGSRQAKTKPLRAARPTTQRLNDCIWNRLSLPAVTLELEIKVDCRFLFLQVVVFFSVANYDVRVIIRYKIGASADGRLPFWYACFAKKKHLSVSLFGLF